MKLFAIALLGAVAGGRKYGRPQVPLEDGKTDKNSKDVTEWPGVDNDRRTCGSRLNHEYPLVNHTCTMTLPNVRRLFIGQGVFVHEQTGNEDFEFYGLEDVTGNEVDIVVFWEQDYDSNGDGLDNSTCGTSQMISDALSCVRNYEGDGDQRGFPEGSYFMENINDHRHNEVDDQNWNFEVATIREWDAGHGGILYTFQINDHNRNGVGMKNITCIHCNWISDPGNMDQDQWGHWSSETGFFSAVVTGQHRSKLFHFFGTRLDANSTTEPDMWKSSVQADISGFNGDDKDRRQRYIGGVTDWTQGDFIVTDKHDEVNHRYT